MGPYPLLLSHASLKARSVPSTTRGPWAHSGGGLAAGRRGVRGASRASRSHIESPHSLRRIGSPKALVRQRLGARPLESPAHPLAATPRPLRCPCAQRGSWGWTRAAVSVPGRQGEASGEAPLHVLTG